MEKDWTVGSVLSWTENYLNEKKITGARLEAEILLSSVMDCPRLNLHIRKDEVLPEEKLKNYRDLILKRQKRIPISYILGEQSFFGMDILVNEHTLIPRPETEILVEEALKILKGSAGKMVADICTGSGCIAVALAKFSSAAKIYACDLSSDAVKIAYENAARQEVLAKIVVKNGDLLNALAGEQLEGKLDMIISNPPYIAHDEFGALEPEIGYEPRMALDGGKDGLNFYRLLAFGSRHFLKAGASLVLEMNSNKSAEISEIVKKNGFSIERIVKDYAGLDRVLIGKFNG